MPPIRFHDPQPFDDLDDDDGLPPLVDAPPSSSMTFTFSTDMTPITYGTDPTTFQVCPSHLSLDLVPSNLSTTAAAPPPLQPPSPPSRGHSPNSKKRDASYIPRPPNAFILFRSSFIRSQHVPGRVEGNHSTLSKIVGIVWKKLPREEREVWEAKALVAQAEHRKRYPDWRFRPGANALAKLKIKDGGGCSFDGGGDGGNHRKKPAQRKPKDEDAEEKGRMKEQRCVKIAHLVTQGKTGPDLAAAVREWESGERRTGRRKAQKEEEGQIMLDVVIEPMGEKRHREGRESVSPPRDVARSATMPRSQTPNASLEAHAQFKVPLTSMFRRSLSAPAPTSNSRSPTPSQDSFDSGCLSPASTYPEEVEDHQHAHSGVSQNDYGLLAESPLSMPVNANSFVYSSENPDLAMTSPSMVVSPLSECFHLDPTPKCLPAASPPLSTYPFFYPGYAMYPHDGTCGYPSSYSTLQGWAGAGDVGPMMMMAPSPPIVPALPAPMVDEPVPYAGAYSLRAASKHAYQQQQPVAPHYQSFGLGLGLGWPWVEPFV